MTDTSTPIGAARLKAEARRAADLIPAGDLLLAVLKTHLLIEEYLHATIVAWVVDPRPILRTRFSFLQRMRLAQAIAGRMAMPFVWDALMELNNVRNKLVHRAEPGDIEQLLTEFVRICESNEAMRGLLAGHPATQTTYRLLAGITGTVAVIPEIVRILVEENYRGHGPRPPV